MLAIEKAGTGRVSPINIFLDNNLESTKVSLQKAIHHLNIQQGHKDLHLYLTQSAQLQVLPGVPTYIKVAAQPCTLCFAYETLFGDLAVYISNTHKLPNK